jgi:hypothetical protein
VETRPDGRRVIRRVRAVRQPTEDEFTITATYLADCTGDGGRGARRRLPDRSGSEKRVRRDARARCGRSPDARQLDPDHGRRYDQPQPLVSPAWTRRFQQSDFKHRQILSYEYGYWWFEWGGQLDSIKDNERIRHELLRTALGVWDYIKNS